MPAIESTKAMAKYFFDVFDGSVSRDDEGQELPDFQAIRKTAMSALPAIAAEEIPEDGDKQNFIVIARDEAGNAVYTATLSFVGLKLPDPTGSS